MLSNTYDGRVQLCAFVQTPDGRLLHPTVAVWRTHSDAMAFIQEHALDNVADKTMEANSNDATPVIWKVHETTDDELRGLLEASTKA